MILKGLKFGMMLQLAVGPMCLMVYNTSSNDGVREGLVLVLAIALIDALYITLAGLGVASVMQKQKVQRIIKLFGCLILIVFGINTITGAFDFSLLPNISIFGNEGNSNIFIQGMLLTASNPLTIIFWSGVFSTQVMDKGLNKKQLIYFGSGCVLSTLIFMSFIAVLSNIISGFLPSVIIRTLNVLVGILLIYFGIRLLFKKVKKDLEGGNLVN